MPSAVAALNQGKPVGQANPEQSGNKYPVSQVHTAAVVTAVSEVTSIEVEEDWHVPCPEQAFGQMSALAHVRYAKTMTRRSICFCRNCFDLLLFMVLFCNLQATTSFLNLF